MNTKLDIESEKRGQIPRSFGREITNFPSYLVKHFKFSPSYTFTVEREKVQRPKN